MIVLSRRQSGQALVEFALVLPLLLALLLTIISLWPILNAADAVTMAAASGAHEAAITGGNKAQTTTQIHDNLAAAGLGINHPPTITISCAPCSRYEPVTVAVAVPVEPWIELFWLPDSVSVDATYTRASEVDGGQLHDSVIIPPDSVPDLPELPGTIPGDQQGDYPVPLPGSDPRQAPQIPGMPPSSGGDQ